MVLKIVILAAGHGRRMISSIPKILRNLGGIPLLEHVVNTAQSLCPYIIHVVYNENHTRETLSYLPVHWVKQKKQLGTGHAVLQVIPFFQNEDQILILYGDVPLISSKTLNAVLKKTPLNGLGIIVSEPSNPTGLGRIIRDNFGNILKIVEHKDTNKHQLAIHEVNTGIMTTTAINLRKWLPKLDNKNAQKEYYLTDIVALATADDCPVVGVIADCYEEVQGVNNLWELMKLERYYQRLKAKQLALTGTIIMDPERFDVRGKIFKFLPMWLSM